MCPTSCLCVACNSHLTDDKVYMENADQRREYIQNGNGKIFVGKYNNMSVFDWEYEQVGSWDSHPCSCVCTFTKPLTSYLLTMYARITLLSVCPPCAAIIVLFVT